MSKQLEEAISRLKIIHDYKKQVYDMCEMKTKIVPELSNENRNAIEIILKELERLQEENSELKLKERNRCLGKYGEIEVHVLINKTLQEDYIPKETIKEKIEECIKNIEEDERHDEWGYEHCKIQVLNQLLKRRKRWIKKETKVLLKYL